MGNSRSKQKNMRRSGSFVDKSKRKPEEEVEASVRLQISEYLSRDKGPVIFQNGQSLPARNVPKVGTTKSTIPIPNEEISVRKELLDLLGLFYLDHDFKRLIQNELNLPKLADWTLENGMKPLNVRLQRRFGEDLRGFAARTRITQVGVDMVSGTWDNMKEAREEAIARNDKSRLALEKLERELGVKDASNQELSTGIDTIMLMNLLGGPNNTSIMGDIDLKESGLATSAWTIDSMRLELESFFIYADPNGLRKNAFRTAMSYGINVGRRELERLLFFEYRSNLNHGRGPLILTSEAVRDHRELLGALLLSYFRYDRSKQSNPVHSKNNPEFTNQLSIRTRAGSSGDVIGNTQTFQSGMTIEEIDSLVSFAIDTGLAKLNGKLKTQYDFDLTDYMLTYKEYKRLIPKQPVNTNAMPQDPIKARVKGSKERKPKQRTGTSATGSSTATRRHNKQKKERKKPRGGENKDNKSKSPNWPKAAAAAAGTGQVSNGPGNSLNYRRPPKYTRKMTLESFKSRGGDYRVVLNRKHSL